jgi:vacuolar-type H+-ATPase subunit E/Vma4
VVVEMRRESPDGVAELISRLEQRARAEIVALRTQTAERVAAAEREAAGARNARRVAALRECDASVEAEAASALAAAATDARRELLDAQHALVDAVLARAAARLPALLSGERLADEQLVRRFRGMTTYLDGAPAEVRCRRELAERVRALLVPEWPASHVVADDTITGLRALDGNGRITIDDTLETRLERLRAELTIEICRAAEPERRMEAAVI